MKKILFLATLIMLVLVLFCSCSNTLTAVTTEAENPNMIYITLDDISGSTGYTWDYAISDETVVKFVSCETEQVDTDKVGVPLKCTWTFEGIKDGDSEITMTLTPPASDTPDRTIVYQYQIQDNVAVLVDTIDSEKEINAELNSTEE